MVVDVYHFVFLLYFFFLILCPLSQKCASDSPRKDEDYNSYFAKKQWKINKNTKKNIKKK